MLNRSTLFAMSLLCCCFPALAGVGEFWPNDYWEKATPDEAGLNATEQYRLKPFPRGCWMLEVRRPLRGLLS